MMFNIWIQISLVTKGSSPKLCSISFSDPEVVSLKQTIGEDGFELGEHVTEDQRQLGQVSSEEKKKRGKHKLAKLWEISQQLFINIHTNIQLQAGKWKCNYV